jgi:CO dehydrogenase/acetyl-CoA synthase delta subunit
MMSTRVFCDIGTEAWKVHESVDSEEEHPGWGALEERGPLWKMTMATALLQSGADLLLM